MPKPNFMKVKPEVRKIMSGRNIGLVVFIVVALFLGSLNMMKPYMNKEGMTKEGADPSMPPMDEEEDEKEGDQ